MNKSKKNTTPLESAEQSALFQWATNMEAEIPELWTLNGSMNGVRLASPGVRVKAKRQGVKKGFPDINLPVTTESYAGLYIELKRQKGGTVSREQKEWLKVLNEHGYLAVVCRGCEDAKKTILEYLGR